MYNDINYIVIHPRVTRHYVIVQKHMVQIGLRV